MTLQVQHEASLGFLTFAECIEKFSAIGPGLDNVNFIFREGIPLNKDHELGQEIYNNPPWIIYENNGVRCYKRVASSSSPNNVLLLAFFEDEYRSATIFIQDSFFQKGLKHKFTSLSLFPTDQIWLTHLLAKRDALLIHSAAAIIDGKGSIFVGPSGAGKSTLLYLLNQSSTHSKNKRIEVLCDDRNILRRWRDGWKVHGTWSHGELPDVSPQFAPLNGVYFLEQSPQNSISPVLDQRTLLKLLLPRIIRTSLSSLFIHQVLNTVEILLQESRFFILRFNKTGNIKNLLYDTH